MALAFRSSSSKPHVPHWMRVQLFHIKRYLGLSTRGDRPHLVREVSRLIRKGAIGQQTRITAHGRGDGAGAQAMAKYSALAFARHHGLTYVHTPFGAIEHAEGVSPEAWGAMWEQLLNIGRDEITASGHAPVGIERLVTTPALWRAPCMLVAGHYTRFTDRLPEAYTAILSDIRRRYRPSPRPRTGRLLVAAHVRRGDVNVANPRTAHRVTDLDTLATTLEAVKRVIIRTGLPADYTIVSQGEPGDLLRFVDRGWSLSLDTPAPDALHTLASADILIMAPSSLSFIAGLLNPGLVIYTPFARSPLPSWLVRSPHGHIDTHRLFEAVAPPLAPLLSERSLVSQAQPLRARG